MKGINSPVHLQKQPKLYGYKVMQAIKLVFLVLCIVFSSNCKKSPVNTTPDYTTILIGKWSLNTLDDITQDSSFSASQFPCISDNVSTFSSDNTSVANYTGKDTCFVYQKFYNQYEAIGEPNETPATSTWTIHNNLVYLTSPDGIKSTGTITMVSNSYHLDIRDTILYNGSVFDISHATYIKL